MKKLNLSRETLRLLDSPTLESVRGGLMDDTSADTDPNGLIKKPVSNKYSCSPCSIVYQP